jgi:hypothetical protein
MPSHFVLTLWEDKYMIGTLEVFQHIAVIAIKNYVFPLIVSYSFSSFPGDVSTQKKIYLLK